MKISVQGIKVGHYTDEKNLTGCTVILCPEKTVASCEARGSSPASRELVLLSPEKQMQEVNAVFLTGGSAFGLGAANGVMQYLVDHQLGYQTPWTRVPIVPSAVIFDLNVGSNTVFPLPENAYAACESAGEEIVSGRAGAGTGATIGKWGGITNAMKGGFGAASITVNGTSVDAFAVVNAVGDVVDEKGNILAGARSGGKFLAEQHSWRMQEERLILRNINTTLVVIATNAKLSKVDVFRVAQRGHSGMARSIVPCHTTFDGDVCFALSAGEAEASVDFVSELGAEAAARAVRNAVCASNNLPER